MPAELTPDHRITGEELCRTEAELAALSALREAAGHDDGPIERHGLRMLYICEAMARDRGVEVDRELLLVAGLLHDVGIYDRASRGGVYVTDGREFTADLLAPFGWEPDRLRLCLDAIEHHHRLSAQWELGAEVEFMRRADLVELSANAINYGVDRKWLKKLNASIPRRGAYVEISKRLFAIAKDRPATLPKIFFAGR